MHARCFMRKKPMFSVYYQAVTETDNTDIIGLEYIPEEIKDNQVARKIFFHRIKFPFDSMHAISTKLNIPRATVQNYVGKDFKCLKELGQHLPPKVSELGLVKNEPVLDTKNTISGNDVSVDVDLS